MYKKEVVIGNEAGMHARPASIFVKEAARFKSDIKVIKDDKEANGKSIISILSMGANKDNVITILAEGPDEKEAVDCLVELVESKFNEE